MPRSILLPLLFLVSLGCGVAHADTVGTLLDKANEAEAKGDSDLAARMAQAAIVADPARPEAYVALGDLYAKDHQPEFARSYYDEALAIDPSDAAALKAVAGLDRSASTSIAGTVAHP